MNLAETALADYTTNAETDNTIHGPWPIWDWENLRFSAKENNGDTIVFTVTWYMSLDDTLTVTDTINLTANGTVDQILEVRGAYVSVSGSGGGPLSYRARLWPGEFDFDNGGGGVDQFWKIDSDTLEINTPTVSVSGVQIDPTNNNNAQIFVSDDGTPADALVSAFSTQQITLLANSATAEVLIVGGNKTTINAGFSAGAANGELRLEGNQTVIIAADNGEITLQAPGAPPDGKILLSANGGGDIELLTFGGTITIHVDVGGFIVLENLPIVNPGGSNRLWNNGGTVSIT